MIAAALVFPLLPGKRKALDNFIAALRNEYRAEHDRTHACVTEEKWFLQPTPQGDLVIVYLEGPDPALVFADLAVSQEPFEVWFREQALDITGVDLALLPPFTLPECVFNRTRGLPAPLPLSSDANDASSSLSQKHLREDAEKSLSPRP